MEQITTTREYHDARKRWLNTLPKFDDEIEQVFPKDAAPKSFAIYDMDEMLQGKPNVFFTTGVAMYDYRRRVDSPSTLIGHMKCCIEHPGSIVAFFDDIQGIGFGEVCLTKSLEVVFDVEQVPYGETMQFGTKLDIVVSPDGKRTEITAKGELYTVTVPAQRVAHSRAVFIQTPEILKRDPRKKQQDGEASLEETANKVWDGLAPLRLRGKDRLDPTMSFKLHCELQLPHPQAPEWWDSTDMELVQPEDLPHAFAGRFHLFHAQRSNSVCRAVVQSTRTAEGPIGLFHGGAASSACFEVLSLLHPNLELVEGMLILFRKPIPLGSPVSIEWAYVEEEDGWVGVVLDSQQTVLQQYKVIITEYVEEEEEEMELRESRL